MAEKKEIKGLVELLKEAWGTYKNNAGTYALLILMTIVASMIGIVILLTIGFVISIIAGNILPAVLIAGIIGVPILVYIQVIIQIALLKAVIAGSKGEKMTFSEAMKGNKPLVWPFFIVSILSGFLTIGGMFLFLIPGILFTVWFSLYSYIFMIEGKRGFEALLASKEYIKGYTWKIFLYIVAFGIVTYIVSILPNAIFEQMEVQFLSSIYSTVLNFIIAPLGMLFSLGIYNELKRIKGEVKVENVSGRKWKYVAVGILGFAVPIIIAATMISTFLPILNTIDWSEIENMETEDDSFIIDENYVYPEPV